jgi:hypothetical protein
VKAIVWIVGSTFKVTVLTPDSPRKGWKQRTKPELRELFNDWLAKQPNEPIFSRTEKQA